MSAAPQVARHERPCCLRKRSYSQAHEISLLTVISERMAREQWTVRSGGQDARVLGREAYAKLCEFNGGGA